MKRTNTERSFLSWVILTLVFVVLLAALMSTFNAKLNLDSLASVGSLFQGTLGIAVGMAGSLVAIRLAIFANDIGKRAEHREDFDYLNQKIEEAIKPISLASRELATLYRLEELLISTIKPDVIHFDNLIIENKKSEKKKELYEIINDFWKPENFSIYHELRIKYHDHLKQFVDHLDTIGTNPISTLIWCNKKRQTTNLHGLNMQVGVLEIADLLRRSMYEYYLSPSDPSKFQNNVLRSFFFAQQTSLENGQKIYFDIEDYVYHEKKTLQEVAPVTDIHKDIYVLVSLGADFHTIKNENIGLSIILDFAECLPTPNTIKEVFKTLMNWDNIADFEKLLNESPILKSLDYVSMENRIGPELSAAIKHIEEFGVINN